jgi:hypothetical protein
MSTVLKRALAGVAALALALGVVSVARAQTGWTFQVCTAPAGGIAIRAGDNDGATELGRLYNGNVGRVYATGNTEPSIGDGWATGYGRETDGSVIHGYFRTNHICRTS